MAIEWGKWRPTMEFGGTLCLGKQYDCLAMLYDDIGEPTIQVVATSSVVGCKGHCVCHAFKKDLGGCSMLRLQGISCRQNKIYPEPDQRLAPGNCHSRRPIACLSSNLRSLRYVALGIAVSLSKISRFTSSTSLHNPKHPQKVRKFLRAGSP